MRILLFLTALSFLKLYSCAEETKGEVREKTINDLSSAIVYEIAKFLDDPFSTLGETNEYFKGILSIEFNVKRFFNERFHIPELVTADVDDNDEELKYLLKYSKFAKFADHVYQAFRHEFLYGDKINTLIPNLINYFDRYDPTRSTDEGKILKEEEIDVLIRRKKFDFFFKGEIPLFKNYAENIFEDYESITGLQEYICLNLEYLEHVHSYLQGLIDSDNNDDDDENSIEKWIKVALISNMPETFYIRYQISLIKVLTSTSLWTKTFIPESRYLVLFDRINTLIDLLFVGIERDYHLILNAIRFGPNDPDFYETRIRPNRFVVDQFIHVLCHCASLSNKFNLFEKFTRDYGTSSLSKKYLKQCNNDIQNLPIQIHKLYFDLYVVLSEDERHSLGNNSDFFEILSKYYLVSSINWKMLH